MGDSGTLAKSIDLLVIGVSSDSGDMDLTDMVHQVDLGDDFSRVSFARANSHQEARSLLTHDDRAPACFTGDSVPVTLLYIPEDVAEQPEWRQVLTELVSDHQRRRTGVILVGNGERPRNAVVGSQDYLQLPIGVDRLIANARAYNARLVGREKQSRKELPYPVLVSPVRGIDRLEDHLKTRYEVDGPRGMSLLPSELEAVRIDIDGYDIRAEHFDVHVIIEGQRILAGGVRLVTGQESPNAQAVRTLIAQYASMEGSDFFSQRAQLDKVGFPAEAHYNFRDHMPLDLFQGEFGGTFIVEHLSHPNGEEQISTRGTGLLKRLYEFGFAWALERDIRYLVGVSAIDHKSMWAKFGYQQIPLSDACLVNGGDYLLDGWSMFSTVVNNPSVLYVHDLQRLPEQMAGTVRDIRALFGSLPNDAPRELCFEGGTYTTSARPN